MKTHLTAPPEAMGALYFLPGQYLFKREENGREITKALSSEQIGWAFRDFQIDTGWISRRLLRYREEPDRSIFLSVEPAGIKTILLANKTGEVKEITLPLPTLILFGKGTEYFLWAAKGRKVTPHTRLAAAPLPNLGGTLMGKICFGSNTVPAASAQTVDNVWNLLWQTPFNGDQANDKCCTEPKDVRNLLFRLAKAKIKAFPAKELIESSTTIEQIWTRAVENSR